MQHIIQLAMIWMRRRVTRRLIRIIDASDLQNGNDVYYHHAEAKEGLHMLKVVSAVKRLMTCWKQTSKED